MKRFLKILKRTMIVLLCLCLALAIAIYFYMRQPQFGSLPGGERLELIKKSPNYKDGKLRNLVEKPTISEGYSFSGELGKHFSKPIHAEPSLMCCRL
jgi:hypothetical protein